MEDSLVLLTVEVAAAVVHQHDVLLFEQGVLLLVVTHPLVHQGPLATPLRPDDHEWLVHHLVAPLHAHRPVHPLVDLLQVLLEA